MPSAPAPATPPTSGRLFRAGTIPGILQIIATFLPAARLRLFGSTFSFLHMKWVGGILLLLGVVMAILGAKRREWWLAAASAASLALTMALFQRVRWHPLGMFGDPVFRYAIHPGWGFRLMLLTPLLGFAMAIWIGVRRATAVLDTPKSTPTPTTAP